MWPPKNSSNIVLGRAWSPSLHLHHLRSGNHNIHIHASIVHLPGAGKGFMPSLKKCPNRYEKTPPPILENMSNIVLGRAWSPSLHWHHCSSGKCDQWDKAPMEIWLIPTAWKSGNSCTHTDIKFRVNFSDLCRCIRAFISSSNKDTSDTALTQTAWRGRSIRFDVSSRNQ